MWLAKMIMLSRNIEDDEWIKNKMVIKFNFKFIFEFNSQIFFFFYFKIKSMTITKHRK